MLSLLCCPPMYTPITYMYMHADKGIPSRANPNPNQRSNHVVIHKINSNKNSVNHQVVHLIQRGKLSAPQ